MFISHLYIFLDEIFHQFFAYFFKMGCLVFFFFKLNFKSFLIHSGYQPFIRCVSYKNFLPVCGLVFYLFNRVLQRAEVLNFDEFQYINVSSMVCVISKKSLPNPSHKYFLLFFFLEDFMVLDFTFGLNFELIFEYNARYGSFFAYGWPIVPAPIVERTISSPLN